MKVLPDGTRNPEILEEGFEIPEGLRTPEIPQPRESSEETERVEKTREAEEFLGKLDAEEAEELAAPERDSSPQLDWPEAEGGPGGEISVNRYVRDFALKHGTTEGEVDAARNG